MSGSLLGSVGDVQIGQDSIGTGIYPDPVLCRRGDWRSARALSSPMVWVNEDFNPALSWDVITNDVPNIQRPGSRPTVDIPTTRKLQFTITVVGPSPTGVQTIFLALMRVMAPNMLNAYSNRAAPPLVVQELAFSTESGTYVLYGRYRVVSVSSFATMGFNVAQLVVRFEATDPVIYTTAVTIINIPANTTNLPHPLTSATPPSGGSSTSITFLGETSPRVRIYVHGPAYNPAVFAMLTSGASQTTEWRAIGVGGNRISGGSSVNIIVPDDTYFYFEMNDRTTRVFPNPLNQIFYWDQYISLRSSWFDPWPAASFKFFPNGGDARYEAGVTECNLEYQKGYWTVI